MRPLGKKSGIFFRSNRGTNRKEGKIGAEAGKGRGERGREESGHTQMPTKEKSREMVSYLSLGKGRKLRVIRRLVNPVEEREGRNFVISGGKRGKRSSLTCWKFSSKNEKRRGRFRIHRHIGGHFKKRRKEGEKDNKKRRGIEHSIFEEWRRSCREEKKKYW